MRENITAFLNQGEKNYKSKSNSIRNFIGFQVIFPIPVAIGLIMGNEFIKASLICIAIVTIISIIAAIVCGRIRKINNVFSYNFLMWTELGINFLVFTVDLYYIRYKNFVLCAIIACVAIIICIMHWFLNMIAVRKGRYVKKPRNMETIIIAASTVGAVIGRNIDACIMPQLSQNTVLEIIAAMCAFLSMLF